MGQGGFYSGLPVPCTPKARAVFVFRQKVGFSGGFPPTLLHLEILPRKITNRTSDKAQSWPTPTKSNFLPSGPHHLQKADDVVLMASSVCDIQHSLDHFAAECEAARMRISTSKSEAMVLGRKPIDCPLQVGNEVLPPVKEFRALITNEGTME